MHGQVCNHNFSGTNSNRIELGAIFTWVSIPKMVRPPLAESVERSGPDILMASAACPEHVAVRLLSSILLT